MKLSHINHLNHLSLVSIGSSLRVQGQETFQYTVEDNKRNWGNSTRLNAVHMPQLPMCICALYNGANSTTKLTTTVWVTCLSWAIELLYNSQNKMTASKLSQKTISIHWRNIGIITTIPVHQNFLTYSQEFLSFKTKYIRKTSASQSMQEADISQCY